MPTIKEIVHKVAVEHHAKGPGFAQTRPVITAALEQVRLVGAPPKDLDLARQQEVLTAFYDLFRSGELSWGYDSNNPERPFFHVARR